MVDGCLPDQSNYLHLMLKHTQKVDEDFDSNIMDMIVLKMELSEMTVGEQDCEKMLQTPIANHVVAHVERFNRRG